jgi:threonine/homoserine/homoserine lactone efflux protein
MLEFFIAALVVAVAPGPDNLFVLAQSAIHGAKAGFCVICGLCTGIVIQVTLLVLGVSALIAASPKAFFVMQCLGATYLLYLAYKSFQVRSGVILSEAQSAESKDLGAKKLYLRGIIMNITNPKAVLFALSFIPPAVKMDSPLNPTVQMVILGAEFILATFIVFGSVALLAGAVKKFMLKSPKANRNLNRFSGAVFVLLAVALFAL